MKSREKSQGSEIKTDENSGPNETLLIVLVGLGAVSTTLAAGVMIHAVRGTQPYSLWCCSDKSSPFRSVSIPCIRFAAFDLSCINAYDAARQAGVLQERELEDIRPGLEDLCACEGITDGQIVEIGNAAAVQRVRDTLRSMMANTRADRTVMLLVLPTERLNTDLDHRVDVSALDLSPPLTPTIVYTTAAILEGIPVGNLTPNRCLDLPWIVDLATREGVPVAGSDLKTGQTFLKTVIAPSLLDRGLTITGWYSTNILGNSDGENLKQTASQNAKVRSKKYCLEDIIRGRNSNITPDHVVRIDYYSPRGDNKESWDCVDFVGWLGYCMSLRLNLHCRDSILAAPLALDVAILLGASQAAGLTGPLSWMNAFFKTPIPSLHPAYSCHAFSEQIDVLRKSASMLLPTVKCATKMVTPSAALKAFQAVFQCTLDDVRRQRLGPSHTQLDRIIEDAIVDRLRGYLPGVAFVGEERGRVGEKNSPWIVLIDPIDGSENAARGMPDFGISMALLRGESIRISSVQAALIGNFGDGRSFYTLRGCGYQPRATTSVTPRTMAFNFDGPWCAELFMKLQKEYPRLRRLGTTAVELALLADGALDVFVDLRGLLTPENFVGPSLLIQEVGGLVSILNLGADPDLDMGRGYAVVATRSRAEMERLEEIIGFSHDT